jgi:hypothetical protein
MALMFRTSLSAAVLVLAVAVAGAAYLTLQSEPRSVSAEFAALEEDLDELEELAASGGVIPHTEIVELTRRTAELVEKLNEQPAAPIAAQIPEIIERQKDVVSLAASDSAAPELIQAQQELAQAEEKVRVLAARAESPTSQPAAATTTTPPTATPPAATATPGPVATPAALAEDQVAIRILTSDRTYGMTWTEVRTADIEFVIPTTWEVVNIKVNSSGLATLDTAFLRVDGDDIITQINTRTGAITALIDGANVELREDGEDGEIIDLEELIEVAGDDAPALRHLLETFTFID